VIRRVGVQDQFGESGTSEEIKECYKLTAPFIKKAVQESLKAKRRKATPPKPRARRGKKR
jgi:deoxyxylulose-5-phosphate synthase